MNLIQRAARSVRKVEMVEEAPTNEEADVERINRAGMFGGFVC